MDNSIFLAALNIDEDDRLTLLAYADFLEEEGRGEVLAKGLRTLSSMKLRPGFHQRGRWIITYPDFDWQSRSVSVHYGS